MPTSLQPSQVKTPFGYADQPCPNPIGVGSLTLRRLCSIIRSHLHLLRINMVHEPYDFIGQHLEVCGLAIAERTEPVALLENLAKLF